MVHYKRSPGEIIFTVFNHLFMVFIAFVCVVPLWHVLVASFSDPTAVNLSSGLILLPKGQIQTVAYQLIMKYEKIWIGYRNTIMYIIGSCTVTGLMTVLAGYAFSKKTFYYRNKFMMIITFTMMFHGGMIPTFMVIKKIGFLDTPLALIIPGCLSVFNIIMMRTAIQNVPISLSEAAKMDGASELAILFRVILPLCKPTIAVILLFTAIGKWNDWYSAMIYLPNATNLYPLQMFLREILITETQSVTSLEDAEKSTALYKTLTQYATIIVSTVPILCVYPFVQKYFVTGMTIGAVKG